MNITTLGEAHYPSPIGHAVSETARVPERLVRDPATDGVESGEPLEFELAGPRSRLFFDPRTTRAGIVTCGGLCPGLNNVIRSVFLELYHGYGIPEVVGFRNGYSGLDPRLGREPMRLNAELVDDIHREGGTILGTSRGPVDIAVAVENLVRLGVNLLFTVGGDGTQRGGA